MITLLTAVFFYKIKSNPYLEPPAGKDAIKSIQYALYLNPGYAIGKTFECVELVKTGWEAMKQGSKEVKTCHYGAAVSRVIA